MNVQGEKWAANLWVWNGPRIGFGMKRNNVTRHFVQATEAVRQSLLGAINKFIYTY